MTAPAPPPAEDSQGDDPEGANYSIDWARKELMAMPVGELYPDLVDECCQIMQGWRRAFPRRVWIRVMRRDRILKEINEIAPLIQEFREFVARTELEPGRKFTIVDLCCGYGYLSMFLSEMLPESKVSRFVLVDKQWPMRDHPTLEHHINPDHLHLQGVWKIRMHTRKVNIKKASEIRQLHEYVFNVATGPVIVSAVHLCGTLSIRAVEMFNTSPKLALMVLKPCCLPGKNHAKAGEVWTLGGHTFSAREVYGTKRGEHKGPDKFRLWTKHLYLGVDLDERYKDLEKIRVQRKHFQNLYVFARRPHPLPGCVAPVVWVPRPAAIQGLIVAWYAARVAGWLGRREAG